MPEFMLHFGIVFIILYIIGISFLRTCRNPWIMIMMVQQSALITYLKNKYEIYMPAFQGGGGNQAYSRLSTTHGHITNCKLDSVVMQVYSWYLVRVKRSAPDNFWMQSHRFNSSTGEQKGINHSDHLYWQHSEAMRFFNIVYFLIHSFQIAAYIIPCIKNIHMFSDSHN